ncbi:GNAT family N-acetyltransferase [Hanstruepera marina]|uniref:GNAT family N-acetyltransferase n=1 Tax=Hanstruepera marina TaxID=2873265 RepID=UPI001CA78544|nr:GNAT family N-acetyltransferase [Hanstruepera marina]
MEVKHTINDQKGVFFVEKDNHRLAEMTYSKAGPDKIIIDHTEVDDSLRGQGVGKLLVKAAVDYARELQIKILPLCPFAAAVFKKQTEYNDVLF